MTLAENRARVVRTLLQLKRAGQVQRRRRVPRMRLPFTIEVEYAKRLLSVVQRVRDVTAPLLRELPELVTRPPARAADRVHILITHAYDHLPDRVWARRLAAEFAQRTAEHARREYARVVQAVLGVDMALLGLATNVRMPRADAIDAVLDRFVAENVALIKSLGEQPLDQMERIITRGFANGDRHETLAQEISKRYEVAESRARLIARDQIAKLNAQTTRDGNQTLGINQFRWLSMRDKAVRSLHASRDQRSHGGNPPFSYDGTQGERPTSLPGEDVMCRCLDEPVFDAILDELARLEAM